MKEQFELESLLRVDENSGNQVVYNLCYIRQKQKKPLLFKLTLRFTAVKRVKFAKVKRNT